MSSRLILFLFKSKLVLKSQLIFEILPILERFFQFWNYSSNFGRIWNYLEKLEKLEELG